MKPEIIEALKKNEKPFGLMSAELQEAAREIGVTHLTQLSEDVWLKRRPDDPIRPHLTYRLHPDYEPEPSATIFPKVTCDVFEKGKCPRENKK